MDRHQMDAPAGVPLNPPTPQTSVLAVLSLLFSLLTILLGPLGFIPGIVFGHLARSEIRRRPEMSGRGVATAGLVIGYIFLGLTVLAVVLAIALVMFFLGSWAELLKLILEQSGQTSI